MMKFKLFALFALLPLLAGSAAAQGEQEKMKKNDGLKGNLVRSSKVLGMEVKNPANDKLGEIEDVVLDTTKGTIAYAVVSFGGFLDIGDKLFAMPWNALKPSADHATLVLDIPKEKLEKAPGFDKNDWPDMADPKWTKDIRTFYMTKHPDELGAAGKPAEERAGVNGMDQEEERAVGFREDLDREHGAEADPADRDVGVAMDRDRGDRADHGANGFAENGAADSPALRDMSGTVTRVESGPCESAQGRLAWIRTGDDAERVIALGPAATMDQRRWIVYPNDRIEVRGYDYDARNGRIFMATEVRRGNDVWRIRDARGNPLWNYQHGDPLSR